MKYLNFCRLYLQNIISFSQNYPPLFIEALMLFLAIIFLIIWFFTLKWAFLSLSLSYVIGASVSALIREFLFPSYQRKMVRSISIISLIISCYGFIDIFRYY